jgi:PKD repeat protein
MDPKDPVLLLANPESGTDPLTVQFSILTDLNANIVSMTLDADGDGMDDLSFADLSDEPLFTYPHPGLYKATVTLTDDQDVAYTDTIAINVLSLEDLDALLKARWEGMKEKLMANDINGGLTFFIPGSQERYEAIFSALDDNLPEIIYEMQEIEFIYSTNNLAKYRIRREEDNGPITYYIYFILDENGVWKIKQF